jgi:cytochrome c biogenesis protein
MLTAASIVGSYTTRTNLIDVPKDVTALEKFFKTYDIFHSWWFTILVIVFTINLILCAIHHFIPHLKIYFSKELFNEKAVMSPWISGKIKTNRAADTLKTDLIKTKQYLRKKGFKIYNTPKGDVAEKGRYSRLLPFSFHLGILVVILGTLIGSFFGFVGTANIHAQTETNKFFNWTKLEDDKFDFDMRVEDFYLEYSPIPIRVGVKDKKTDEKLEMFKMMEKEYFVISNSPFKVFVIEVLVDERFTIPKFYFTLYKNDQLVGNFYSDQDIEDFPYGLVLVSVWPPRVPKVMRAKFQIKKDGVIQAEDFIEVNHPMTYEGITFYETSFARDPYGFLYVGFQIVSDPGVEIVYIGFALMFVPVIFIFFASHKKIYITNDDRYIFLTGEATKGKKDFKEEFFGYVNELKKDLK